MLALSAEPGDEETTAANLPSALRDNRGQRAPRGSRESPEREFDGHGLGSHQAAQRATQLLAEWIPGAVLDLRRASPHRP